MFVFHPTLVAQTRCECDECVTVAHIKSWSPKSLEWHGSTVVSPKLTCYANPNALWKAVSRLILMHGIIPNAYDLVRYMLLTGATVLELMHGVVTKLSLSQTRCGT